MGHQKSKKVEYNVFVDEKRKQSVGQIFFYPGNCNPFDGYHINLWSILLLLKVIAFYSASFLLQREVRLNS